MEAGAAAIRGEVHRIGHIRLCHEMGENGRHRLVVPISIKGVGEWANYDELCSIKIGSSLYCGTTDYYKGFLPVVFKVVPPRKAGGSSYERNGE